MRPRAFSSWMIIGGAMAALAACQPAKPTAAPGSTLAWAYPTAPNAPLPPYPKGELRTPGSPVVYQGDALNNGAGPPDWFPANHPPAPAPVAKGRKDVLACAECHQVEGGGYLGTPNLAGLPADYIIQQVHEFRDGRRRSWESGRPATGEMIAVAAKITDAELAQAAAYYAALPYKPRYRVVEGDSAPAHKPNHYGWFDRVPGQPPKPLNGQVVELAEDEARMLIADPNSGVVVHAPTGSTASGETLVRSGGPGGQACASCHGPGLKGSAIAPPLAGRSAAYIARQLLDIKTGTRTGPAVTQMQGPARGLSDDQIRDIAVYAASLRP